MFIIKETIMWKQLKQLMILFLCLTSVSLRPLDEPTKSSNGSSIGDISSSGYSFDGISQYVLTDNDVDVNTTVLFIYCDIYDNKMTYY